MAALAVVGYRLIVLLPDLADDENTLDRKLSLAFLMATSGVCVALSAIDPAKTPWVYVLNLGEPQVARWIISRRAVGASRT
jgi:hypothetical protein